MTGSQDGDDRKVSALAQLPQAIDPPRDLWPGIEARLNGSASAAPADSAQPPTRAQRNVARLRWLAAAAMVASVAVGVWIGRSVLPGSAAPAVSAQNSVTMPDAPTLLDAAYVKDPRYTRQRAALLRSAQAQLATMQPASRDKVLASLAAIQHAKEDLEQALGKDPGNALLQELLVNTYQDEMRVLTDVHEAGVTGTGI
jgi:ferric-dicitrate binding protein FerR (iron transport regulator)